MFRFHGVVWSWSVLYQFQRAHLEGNTMATNNFDKMSYAELVKFHERLLQAIANKRSEDAAATKEQLRAMAEKAGFDVNELFGKRRGKRGPFGIKYRNTKDPSQTWTGRGRKPNWLVDALKKGAKIDSFGV
jgi:DNA-binding protein H-NS